MCRYAHNANRKRENQLDLVRARFKVQCCRHIVCKIAAIHYLRVLCKFGLSSHWQCVLSGTLDILGLQLYVICMHMSPEKPLNQSKHDKRRCVGT